MLKKNIPNYLVILRILLIPLIISAFFISNLLAFILFATAAITDFFDGYLARKWDATSDYGAMIDQVSDKLLVVSIILTLLYLGRVELVPCLLIIFREIFVSGLREHLGKKQIDVPVTQLTKIKTALQMLALAILIIAPIIGTTLLSIGQVLFWISAILTFYTGIEYVAKSYKHLK